MSSLASSFATYCAFSIVFDKALHKDICNIGKFKSLSDVKNSKSLYESRVKRLTAEKESLEKEKDFLFNDNKKLKTDKDKLKKQIDELIAEKSCLEVELQKLSSDKEYLKSDKEYLNKELSNAYDEIKSLKSEKKSDSDLVDEDNFEEKQLSNETANNFDIASIEEAVIEVVKKQFEVDMANFFKFWLMKRRKNWKQFIMRM